MHSVHTLAAWVVNRCAACTWLVRAVRCVHMAGPRGALRAHGGHARCAGDASCPRLGRCWLASTRRGPGPSGHSRRLTRAA